MHCSMCCPNPCSSWGWWWTPTWVDPHVSSPNQVLAADSPSCGLPMSQRVTVLASWNCSRSRECQLEVRSSEPQVRQGTRCQRIAEQLQQSGIR